MLSLQTILRAWKTHRRNWLAIIAMVTLVAGGVSATNYSLWINGRNGGGAVGNYSDFTYWGPSATAAGVNKKAVNWDGTSRISTSNGIVRNALDCYCTGTNWCYLAVHSAGNLQIGYAMSLFGGTARNIKTPSPAANGTCSDAGGTQTGWNIKWVDVASGAAGGSELADLGSWAVSDALTQDLRTTAARAMYDHSQTRNTWFYLYAGASGTAYSALLPGQDDEAVAYHSSGGTSGSSGRGLCNPSDWLCNDLKTGSAANEGGSTKWGYHSVVFRDDAESYNHYTNANWAGIVAKVRADMVTNAQ